MNEPARRHNLLRFLAYVWPQWPLLLGGTLCGIGKFCFPILGAYAVQIVTDVVLIGTAAGDTAAVADKIGWFGLVPWLAIPPVWDAPARTAFLVKLLSTIAAIYLFVYAPSIYLRTVLTGRATHLSIFRLRYDLFCHIQRLSHRFFDTRQTGGIVSRMTADVALAQNLIGQAGTTLWIDLVSLSVYAFVLLGANATLAGVTFAVLPVYVLMLVLFKGPIKDTSRAVQTCLEAISGDLHERVRGISVVKSFTRERREARKFFADTRDLFDLTMRNVRLSAQFNTGSTLVVTLAPLVVLFFGARLVIAGQLSAGELFFFMIMIGHFYNPLNQLTNLSVILSNALAAIDRIFEVFDIEPDVEEVENAYAPDSVAGEVEFRNVSFQYGEGRAALRGVSCRARPGQVIALVGPSGSGKSTFAKLICRFYDPQEGQVLVDGRNVREWRLKSLRGAIGLVMQDTIVFSGTVRENLLYGNPKASEAELVAAARRANAHEFITDLPQGYDTVIGENGCQLSGGQRQRLSIARAFLRDPRILILDEATASLDPHSETLIQEALARLMRGRTTFLIAHRLATVVHADRLLIFDNGTIVESGTHEELLARGGLYADLYRQQVQAMSGTLALGRTGDDEAALTHSPEVVLPAAQR